MPPEVTGVKSIVDYVVTLGGYGSLIVFVIASYFKKVAWYYQLEEKDKQIAEIKKDRDEFKAMAFRALEITERTQRSAGIGEK